MFFPFMRGKRSVALIGCETIGTHKVAFVRMRDQMTFQKIRVAECHTALIALMRFFIVIMRSGYMRTKISFSLELSPTIITCLVEPC